MNKQIKKQVYDKYGGKCAYTGALLDADWQIDHIEPKSSFIWRQQDYVKKIYGIDCEVNDIQNLNPAQKIINHYKRHLSIDEFRARVNNLHNVLNRLPKNTKIEKTKKRIEYMYKIAELFGVTKDHSFSGRFYFETLN